MTFFIIFGILCLVVYIITFNNRDKSQDYKIDPKIGYLRLVNEDKLRLDLTVGLEGLIKKSFGDVKHLGIKENDKDHMELTIEIFRQSSLNNIVNIASNYRIPIHLATSVVNEMCDGAYAAYVLEL